jgi:hypothetical protein
VANFDKFLVYELDTSLARDFEKLDLRLDQEIKCELRDEQTGPWSSGVSDCCSDVESGEVCCGVYRF